MKKVISKIKDRIITGAIVVVPIAVIGVVLADLIKNLIAKTAPLTEKMALGGPISRTIVVILILVLVIGVFLFINGRILKTYVGKGFSNWLEKKILVYVPFYKTLKGVTNQFAGVGEKNYQLVEVDLYGNNNKLLGLITETLSDGRFFVYIPFAPVINIGQVHIVAKENVKILDISVKEATDIITRIGFDSSKEFKR